MIPLSPLSEVISGRRPASVELAELNKRSSACHILITKPWSILAAMNAVDCRLWSQTFRTRMRVRSHHLGITPHLMPRRFRHSAVTPTGQWEEAQRGDELNHRSSVFLQAKEDFITRSNAKVLRATHKPNRRATFDHSLKFTGSWLVQLFLERPNRRQDCIEGWGFAKDHRFSIFVITHQPPGHVIRW